MKHGTFCLDYLLEMILTAFVVTGLSNCGEDPVFVTDQIGIKLNVKETTVVGSQIEQRKNISTETSNPYASFLQKISAEFGEDPVEIRVEGVILQLTEAKEGVATLEDIFSETAEVFLSPDDSAAGYVVAEVENPTGTGPLTLGLTSTASQLRSFSETLRAGSFRVGIRGKTTLTVSGKFEANLSVTLTFGAYEW